MKKVITMIFFVSCCISINAQNIKQQIQQQQQQQQQKQREEREQREKELKEQLRIKKAQLNLSDLLQLLQSKDLDYVDGYLNKRGWVLYSTNVKEKDDTRSYGNDEEGVAADHKIVTWYFDRNTSNDLAKGWFYFHLYPNYDNAISYTIADDEQLDRLKTELTNGGYERIYPTDAIERGLESVYRNSLYEVNFRKQLKKQYDHGADIRYSFFIYNYKQVEEQKAEAERLAREAKEREEKYQSLIQRAESANVQKQYVSAKQFYTEALVIKPENRNLLSDKIAALDINILCAEAETLFKARQYEKAKAKFADALIIKPNARIDFINEKIKEINDFQLFLTERTYTRYDYEMLEKDDYNAKDNYIESELRNNLLANGESLPQTVVSIVCEVDTFGISTSKFSASVQNQSLNAILEKLSKELKLKQVFINDHTALAKAEFTYTLNYNHAIITVRKNTESIFSDNRDFNIYRSSINSKLEDAPYGKYTFDMNKTVINGKEYDNSKLLRTNVSGGPSNALLSLLVPGLGDHKVSFGKKSGIGTALLTYGCIGAGVGLKIYSNGEYKKYHDATEQTAMDEHYQRANYSNQAFYACMAAGAIVWISDIIWVWSTGAKNKRAQQAYKQSHLSIYYQSDLNVTGLTYAINF
jgi:hypothetical protein